MEIVKNDNGLMDVRGAAKYLGVRVSSIYQMTFKKKIRFVKVGRLCRFRKVDLDKFIENNLQEVTDLNHDVRLTK